MKIGIIGHAGHGKSTLIKAIEFLSKQEVECIECDRNRLIQHEEELKKEMEKLKEKKPERKYSACRAWRRGNKSKLKNWQRDKFWQR